MNSLTTDQPKTRFAPELMSPAGGWPQLRAAIEAGADAVYFGQCFSSEAWGGRSANRGKCAQACRLSYDLVVDGTDRDLGADRYLLSPGDLYAIEQVPELVDIGVSCLKIEGRYKDENYVAATTRAYRRAIDATINRWVARMALAVLRYVERNPLRANMVQRSQDWEWSSLKPTARSGPDGLLWDGPILKPAQWTRHVNGVECQRSGNRSRTQGPATQPCSRHSTG